jgi:hypothetical protein
MRGEVFTITLNGTNFNPSSNTVSFTGPGCIPGCTTNASGTTARVSAQAILPPGVFTTKLTNNSTGLSATGPSVTIAAPAPTLTSLSMDPPTPVKGQLFTITLNGTDLDPSSNTVTFTGPGCVPGCTTTASGTSTHVSGQGILGAVGTFTVTLKNNNTGLTSGSLSVTIAPAGPVISSITTNPGTPVQGQAFTITLNGSDFDPSSNTISFSGPGCANPCTVGATGSATQVSSQVTLTAGTFTVAIKNNVTGKTSAGVSLTVSSPPPAITSLTTNPTPPVQGQAFTLTLHGTDFDPSNNTVAFSGPGCSPCTANAAGSTTQVTAQTTLVAGSFNVTIKNNTTGLTSTGVSLTVSPPAPAITSITTNPTPPVQGQAFTFTLHGTDFDPSSNTVAFSGPGCSPACTVNAGGSATQVAAQATLVAGSFTVTVKNNTTGLTSGGASLTVSPPAPVIGSVTTNPSTAVQGQSFTITLNGSDFDASSNTVFFSGPGCSTPCTINATGNSTRISGQTTLAAAGTFSITVRNNTTGLTSAAASLTIAPAPPVINSITTLPATPVRGQSFTITLNGSYFDASSNTVSFSGPGCGSPCNVTASGSTTQVSAQTTLSAAGSYMVTIKNNTTGLTSTSLPVTVLAATPVITSLTTSPTPPTSGQPFTMTLNGTDFDPSSNTVSFSGPGCPSLCTISASGTATRVSGQVTLTAGLYTVTIKNNVTGLTSAGASLTVSPAAPSIYNITTSPSTPIQGQAFSIALIGSDFDPANNTVYFTGPGCATACTISASGTSTRVSGQAILGAGTFSVTVKNNVTNLVSAPGSLTVSP